MLEYKFSDAYSVKRWAGIKGLDFRSDNGSGNHQFLQRPAPVKSAFRHVLE
jgi:hypothetical protein